MLPSSGTFGTSGFRVCRINIYRKLHSGHHTGILMRQTMYEIVYWYLFNASVQKNLMANDSVECSAGGIADARQGSIQYLDGIKFAGWWGRYDKFIENVWRKRSCQTALKMRVLACLTKFMMFHVHWISLKWGHWSSFYIAQREKTFINSTRIVKNSKQKFDAHIHWKTIFFVENALWVPFHRHFAVQNAQNVTSEAINVKIRPNQGISGAA